MGFEKFNLRSVILIAVAGLMLFGTFLIKIVSHGPIPETGPQFDAIENNRSIVPAIEENQDISVKPTNNIELEEDTQSIKEMKEQIENDRLQQKKIKMLKMQLEQTSLQLEQEKALSEISKLEKENTGVVNDSSDQGQDKYPDIKVVYIGGTADQKEAILSINGNNYSVKEKNRPVKNVQVDSITDTSVTVHFNLPQDLTTTIEYKPE